MPRVLVGCATGEGGRFTRSQTSGRDFRMNKRLAYTEAGLDKKFSANFHGWADDLDGSAHGSGVCGAGRAVLAGSSARKKNGLRSGCIWRSEGIHFLNSPHAEPEPEPEPLNDYCGDCCTANLKAIRSRGK